MSTKTLLHQARLNEWAIHITDQKSSELSVTEWCLQNNLSKHRFFYWQHLLKDEAVNQMLPEIVPLAMPSVIDNSQSEHSQLPVSESTRATCAIRTTNEACITRTNCTTPKHDSCARISINGITIELDSSAPEHFMRSLIKAVCYV